jgi:hypothetical protein
MTSAREGSILLRNFQIFDPPVFCYVQHFQFDTWVRCNGQKGESLPNIMVCHDRLYREYAPCTLI